MDINKYCPIIKEICKTETCIAWDNNGCSIFVLLKKSRRLDFASDRIVDLRERLIKDENIAQELLPEFLEWAKNNKIFRLTRDDVKTFLSLKKNVLLCGPAVRSLWSQARAQLKEFTNQSIIV